LLSVRAGAQGSIAGTVYDSLRTHAPLANATVVLLERDRYATTDARGHFIIDSVPNGHYTIGFMHAVLDSLEMQGPLVAVEVAGGRRTAVSLVTPSAAAVYAHMCPGVRDTGTAVVIGRVRDVDNAAPLAGATVSTDWTEYTLTTSHPRTHRLHAESRTNAAGLYMLCGVPTKVPLEVSTERAGFLAGPTPLLMEDRLISRVDLAISQRDSGARVKPYSDTSAVAAGPPGTASLRGKVRGTGGRPVPDATVAITGTSRSARTDSSGSFHLEHIPAGTRTIEVRAIGLLPVTASIDFATNSVRDTSLSITDAAQLLKPVAVEGSLMESDGFETRHQQGFGSFVTEQEIEKHNYPDLAAVLRGVQGIHVECLANKRLQGIPCFPSPYFVSIMDYGNAGTSGATPGSKGLDRFSGGGSGSGGGGANCPPNFWLDGAPFHVSGPSGFSDFQSMVPVSSIRGIEVYSNPGTIPPQYDLSSSTGCGSIVIWTH
jgi:hypothetical protein